MRIASFTMSLQAPESNIISFTGKIHLITTNSQLAAVSERLAVSKELGFDTETRPSFKKGEFYKVALLQLANETDAYLIRLQKISNFQILKSVFERNDIVKVGVAIRDDLKQLKKTFDFNPQNFVELQELAKANGLQNFGLQGMTEEVLQARLSKRAKITNWEASELTDQQIKYAATDAWIGFKLFHRLRKPN